MFAPSEYVVQTYAAIFCLFMLGLPCEHSLVLIISNKVASYCNLRKLMKNTYTKVTAPVDCCTC